MPKELLPEYVDLFSIKEWNNYIKSGAIAPDDGVGYWATEVYMNREAYAFDQRPEWATHVAWFNK